MKQLRILLSLFLLTISVVQIRAAIRPGNLKVYATSDRGIEFGIEANVPKLDTLLLDNKRMVRVSFDLQASSTTAAGISIPQLAAVLAVPPGESNPRIEIAAQEWLDLPTTLPVSPEIAFDRSGDILLTEPAAATESPWPAIARIDGLGMLRELNVAHIAITPLRRQAGRLQYLRSIRLRVSWNNSPGRSAQSFATASDRSDLAFYRRVVLNRDQVQQFLPVRPKKIFKKADLAGQNFVKMTITENGIYKVDGNLLGANGIDIGQIQVSQLRMFNNGGETLPEKLSDARPDSLTEIPIIVADGGDSRFDPNDAIYFFGRSTNDWRYSKNQSRWEHHTNPYTAQNVYWLSWETRSSSPRRLQPITIGGTGETPQTQALRLQKIENDRINPIRSGREWYDRELSTSSTTANYTFNLQNPAASETAYLRLRIVSITGGRHNLSVFLNGKSVGFFSFVGSSGGEYKALVQQTRLFPIEKGSLQTGENTVQLNYSTQNSFGTIQPDWLELVTEDALTPIDGKVEFATGPDNAVRTFKVENMEGDARVFEISDPLNPRYLAFERQGTAILFSDSLALRNPRRYLVANTTLAPVRLEKYTFSDLRSPGHSADMIIIAHRDFWQQAEQLAEHKRAFRGFDVSLVDIETVLNEFGWGLIDPTAIRDFVAYAYQNWSKPPRYLLLFGDGDYDYRNIDNGAGKDWIPTYQTTELAELQTRNMEAYYTYVSGDDAIMDLAIGRYPIQTATEAQNVVDKLIAYETAPEKGFWRTLFTMVGDDELIRGGTGNQIVHTVDAEDIAENYIPDYLNRRKIYLMEYKGVRSASISGIRKPKAQDDLMTTLNNGTLIVNYVGHGNPQQWAHEIVLIQSEDYSKIENGMRLMFIVAATCDFGRFDMPNAQSFAEDFLNLADKGAIALLTSSRVVYASSNARFNKQYYRQMFGDSLSLLPIGDALVAARLFTSSRVNSEKFTILGDPSLVLAVPKNLAVVNSIEPDSLFALQKIAVTGETRTNRYQPLADNGEMQVTVFDDPKKTTYITEKGSTVRYILPGNLLFRGPATLKGGQFGLGFIVPKDLTYGGKNARISLFSSGQQSDAIGYREHIPISLRSNVLFDDAGPEIQITFQGRETFISGDPVPNEAQLVATIADSISGINVTGEIGHKITLTIDGNTASQLDLTPSFLYFPDNYLAGQLITRLPELSYGRHTAEVKAWDNSNNSAKTYFEFILTASDALQLSEVMNYPNPLQRSTHFTFLLNTDAEVKISIYTVNGRLIQTIDGIQGKPGYNQIPWDGQDADGDVLANGIYLYKIVARGMLNGDEQSVHTIGKLAVQN